jgi:zinc-ribbon domain
VIALVAGYAVALGAAAWVLAPIFSFGAGARALRACPACGTPPEPGARFCSNCGAPLAR